MAEAAVESLKIRKQFEKDFYKKWKDYIHRCKQTGTAIENDKICTLALTCIVCHQFTTTENKDYEKLFFDLLAHALASSEESDYRSAQSERRPKFFSKKPPPGEQQQYIFMWPIALETSQNAETKYFLGVPSQYLQAVSESQPNKETKALCAIFYLTMTDTAGSFHKSLQRRKRAESTVELPCLLSFFKMSSENDKNQVSTLIGEFLAFTNISLEIGFDQCYKFEVVERGYDFKIAGGEVLKFSVKSENRRGKLRHFDEAIDDPSAKSTGGQRLLKTHAVNDSQVILLQNCDCYECTINPVTKIDPTCRRYSAQAIMEETFGKLSSVRQGGKQHYIISLRNYFDLRFAINCFQQREFVKEEGVEGVNLGHAFTELFKEASSRSRLPDDSSCLC